ncbi:MAG: hypothetical protein ACP5JP_09710 [bacterium]
MDFETAYKRLQRRFEDMDHYERVRFYTIVGIALLTLIIVAGLIIIVYLRSLDVVIGVDTTGLLGNPAVFVNNMSNHTLKDVYVEMDGKYIAKADSIKPKHSIVLYFTAFSPVPPAGYRPLKVTVKSGLGVMTKSIPPVGK